MLAITLRRALPHQFWRLLHRAMPLLYVLLVFHALLLAPRGWWLHGSIVVLLALADYGLSGTAPGIGYAPTGALRSS